MLLFLILFGNCEAMARVEQLTLLFFTFQQNIELLRVCGETRIAAIFLSGGVRYHHGGTAARNQLEQFVLISRNYAGTQKMKINFKWKANVINSRNVC